MIKANEEVEYRVARATGKRLGIRLDNRGHGGVLDSDGVEGLEVMDDTERFPVLFEDPEPLGSVGGVGRLDYPAAIFAFRISMI